MDYTKSLEEIREKYKRTDGGAGSGNWGHIGRVGYIGGSQKGGGKAFRLTTKKKGEIQYTSQAKRRYAAKEAIAEASRRADFIAEKFMKSPSPVMSKKFGASLKRLDKARKKAESIEMRQKTADFKKYMMNPDKYMGVLTSNPNASKGILKDVKGRGKIVGGLTGGRVKGTKEGVAIANGTYKRKW